MTSMTQTILDFETELYQEHLEEASFLYEQRLTLFDDPEITWLDIADFEKRFEAHIDALVVGVDLALNVCKAQAMEGDFGELHAAVRVFCRQNRLDFVQECLEALDPEDTERVQAISDAHNHELPAEWEDEFIRSGGRSLLYKFLFFRQDEPSKIMPYGKLRMPYVTI
jgi:hypothetical protein